MRNISATHKFVSCTGVTVDGDITQVHYRDDNSARVAWMTHMKKSKGWFVSARANGLQDPKTLKLGKGLKKAHAVKLCSTYCATGAVSL